MTYLLGINDRLRRVRLMFNTSLELPVDLPALVAAGVNAIAVLCSPGQKTETQAAIKDLYRHIRIPKALLGVVEDAEVAVTAADFLHLLTWNDFTQVKTLIGENCLLGCSCETVKQVDTALESPAVDYLCIGPAENRELIAYAAERAPQDHPRSKVWFAAGGITQTNLNELIDQGVRRVAVTRAIAMAADPIAAAKYFADALFEAREDVLPS